MKNIRRKKQNIFANKKKIEKKAFAKTEPNPLSITNTNPHIPQQYSFPTVLLYFHTTEFYQYRHSFIFFYPIQKFLF